MLHHLKNLTVYFSLIVAGRTSLASACSGVNLFGHCIGFNFAQVYLYGKGLEGTIPADIGKLKDKMLNVWLDGNAITGTIPPQLGQLKKLESLSLNNNKITGTIPPEIGQLKKLVSLSLDENEITGTIPPEIGELTALKFLRVPPASPTPGAARDRPSASQEPLEQRDHRPDPGRDRPAHGARGPASFPRVPDARCAARPPLGVVGASAQTRSPARFRPRSACSRR